MLVKVSSFRNFQPYFVKEHCTRRHPPRHPLQLHSASIELRGTGATAAHSMHCAASFMPRRGSLTLSVTSPSCMTTPGVRIRRLGCRVWPSWMWWHHGLGRQPVGGSTSLSDQRMQSAMMQPTPASQLWPRWQERKRSASGTDVKLLRLFLKVWDASA